MPRSRRYDAPGMVHHVWVRGVEGQTIFLDGDDRRDFVTRLSIVLPDAGTSCLAWALLTNHAHLLVRTGTSSISQVMRRVNTGYARHFNERHDRFGYLFQSRFGSRSATDEPDLRRLVRYVHLNPVAAGLVDRQELHRFTWSGHSALMADRSPHPFEDVGRTLSMFGPSPTVARGALNHFLDSGEPGGDPPVAAEQPGASLLERQWAPANDHLVVDAAARWAAGHVGVPIDVVDGTRRTQLRDAVRARSIAISGASRSGVSAARIAERLHLSLPTVSRLRSRGRSELDEISRAELSDLLENLKS